MSSISWVPYLLQILREVGLKHKVDDAETFTACAQRVAANWADAAVSYEPAAAAAAAMKVRSKCTGIAARLDVLTSTPRNALPPLQCWRPKASCPSCSVPPPAGCRAAGDAPGHQGRCTICAACVPPAGQHRLRAGNQGTRPSIQSKAPTGNVHRTCFWPTLLRLRLPKAMRCIGGMYLHR